MTFPSEVTVTFPSEVTVTFPSEVTVTPPSEGMLTFPCEETFVCDGTVTFPVGQKSEIAPSWVKWKRLLLQQVNRMSASWTFLTCVSRQQVTVTGTSSQQDWRDGCLALWSVIATCDNIKTQITCYGVQHLTVNCLSSSDSGPPVSVAIVHNLTAVK